jgi:hypothetical protein
VKLPWGFDRLYAHQAAAVRRLSSTRVGGPANTLVLSGTGSGKTESFLIPIVDTCLRSPGPGVKAVVIYPMNALANDQLSRLRHLLGHTPGVTFGRYTGDTPDTDGGDERRPGRPADAPSNLLWSRHAMQEAPPNILLTNYVQLELLLLRRRDQQLFAHGAPIYLVVDEIHLFGGVLGSEVAHLLRRFRQHIGVDPGQLCMIGTSATAGEGELPRLLGFASRLFGAPFDSEAAIAEELAPIREVGDDVPPAPEIALADLEAASTPDGLGALAAKTLGVTLPTDGAFTTALGAAIDRYRTVGVVEDALRRPAPLDEAAAALSRLPERAGVDDEMLIREATALLLLGATARVDAIGEDDPQPRFRPRLHQVVRSLIGLSAASRRHADNSFGPVSADAHTARWQPFRWQHVARAVRPIGRVQPPRTR